MAPSSPAALPRDLSRSVRVAIIGSALLAALVVAAKSLRDALLCATVGTAQLPLVMASAAVTTALLAFVAAWVFRKRGPGFGVVGLLALNAVGLVIERAMLGQAARNTALLFY